MDWPGFSQGGLLALTEADLPDLVELGLVGMQGVKDEVGPNQETPKPNSTRLQCLP